MKFHFKQRFSIGLLWALPIVVSLYAIYFVINAIGGKIGKILKFLPPFNNLSFPPIFYNFVGLILTVFIIYILGFMAEIFLGKIILNTVDKILTKMPFIKVIYNTSKDIINSILGNTKKTFRRVVLIRFPHKDARCLAFLTNDNKINIDGENHYGVFIPTTPNPTSGWYLLVREEDLEFTNMDIEEALKIIISAGATIQKEDKIKNAIKNKEIFQQEGKIKK